MVTSSLKAEKRMDVHQCYTFSFSNEFINLRIQLNFEPVEPMDFCVNKTVSTSRETTL